VRSRLSRFLMLLPRQARFSSSKLEKERERERERERYSKTLHLNKTNEDIVRRRSLRERSSRYDEIGPRDRVEAPIDRYPYGDNGGLSLTITLDLQIEGSR